MAKPKRPPLLLLVVAVLLIGGIGAGLWRYSRFNDVHVVNGLPVTVAVTLDGQTVKVAADQHTWFADVPVGTHVITAKLNDDVLETTLIFVKGSGHELVYNIGGAAPLVWERIAYSTRSSASEPQWNMYCGRHFVELDSVDYAFREPPRSISTKGGGTIYKTHLTVDKGGLPTCQSWALDKGTQEMWADWQRLEARIDPKKKTLYAVEEYARQGDLREAQTLLEPLLSKAPDFDLHRLYQSVLLASGQGAKAGARYHRAPDDAQATEEDLYLAARLLPREERLAFVDQALVRFPQSGMLLFARAQALDRRGDTAQALSAYELAEAKPPPAFEWSIIQGHIAALLRLKRYPEAWAAAQSAYRDSTSLDGAVTYANLAAVTGNTADWGAKLKPHQRKWAEALLGIPPHDAGAGKDKELDPDSFKRARELIRATLAPAAGGGKGGRAEPAPPGAALAAAGHLDDSALRLLPDSIVWLLLTEAWRTSDTAAAARLSRHATGYDAPRLDDALRFIATGELSAQLELTTDVHLAVLWLARGRRLATLGEDPKPAFDEARRLDAFHSVVWRALDRWPEAKPGAKFAWLPVD